MRTGIGFGMLLTVKSNITLFISFPFLGVSFLPWEVTFYKLLNKSQFINMCGSW